MFQIRNIKKNPVVKVFIITCIYQGKSCIHAARKRNGDRIKKKKKKKRKKKKEDGRGSSVLIYRNNQKVKIIFLEKKIELEWSLKVETKKKKITITKMNK